MPIHSLWMIRGQAGQFVEKLFEVTDLLPLREQRLLATDCASVITGK